MNSLATSSIRACRRGCAGSGEYRQRGVGLIEVLVAVLIMGVGLLGIAAMQGTALRNSQSSLERSQAVIYTYMILDLMRANRDAALAGGYNLAQTCVVPAAGTLVDNDRRIWMQAVQMGLGSDACGTINCPANSACTITVQWNDSRAAGAAGQGSATESVSTVTRL